MKRLGNKNLQACTFYSIITCTLSYFLQHSALNLLESSIITDYKFLVRLKAPNLLQTIHNFILFCFPSLQWRCGSMTLCYSRKNIPVAHFLLALATVLQKQRCSCKAIFWCIVTLCKDSQLLEILSWRAVLQCKEEVSLIFEALHPSFQQQGTNLGGPYLTSLASLRFPLSLLFSSEVQHTLTFPNIYIPH